MTATYPNEEEEPQAVGLAAKLGAEGIGFKNHGANATLARPTGWATVLWLGSVVPNNSLNSDLWVNTT